MPPLDQAPWQSQSPTILAQQVPDEGPIEPKAKAPDKHWDTIRQHIETRLNWMRTRRWAWWRRSRVIAEFIAPERFHFFITANRTNRDGIIGRAIVNNTATEALQTCGSGLWNGLFNPSKPWFKLGIATPWTNLEQDAKEWLEDTEQRLYVVLGQSNFYSVLAQACQDISSFGTAPVIIYENDETVILCYLPCPGEYFLQVGSTFTVDVLYREYVMTVGQIVEEFKLENCPEQIRLAWSRAGQEIDKEYVVTHAIEPNFPLKSRINGEIVHVVPAVFPYREVYMITALGVDGELSRTGCHEKPFVAGRWSKISNDPYAPTCPGMKALGDTQQLQLMERRAAEYTEKGVRPPMGADVALKNQPASVSPGQTTFMATDGTRPKYWPLFEVLPAWLQAIIAGMEKVEARIRKTFFVDAFMAITQMEGVQPRNEIELSTRNLERLQPLGPPINLLTEEFAGPAIIRILAIMERRKMMKPMPPSLRGITLKINYVGIMQEAQRQAASVGMKDFAQTVGETSEAAIAADLPSPARVVNWDKFTKKLADLNGVDPELIFTDDQLKANDQAHAQAHAQAAAPQQAVIGAQAAQTLSQTPTGPGTLLHAITGGKLGGGAPTAGSA